MKFVIGLLFLIGAWVVWRLLKPKAQEASKDEVITIKIEGPAPFKIEPLTKYDFPEEDIDKDTWEGSFWDVLEPFPTNTSLQIEYEDGAGNKTQRVVDVRQFGPHGDSALLIGHCRMRNATRTFLTERISHCVDAETGETVENVYAFLLEKHKNSPEFSKEKLFENEYDVLRVLFYVGKADGQLRAAEKRVILESCQKLTGDTRLTEKHINDLYSAVDLPSIQAFKMAVGRLAKKGPEACEVLIKSAEDIVATQKTVHPAEQEALDYMRKRFAQQG